MEREREREREKWMALLHVNHATMDNQWSLWRQILALEKEREKFKVFITC